MNKQDYDIATYKPEPEVPDEPELTGVKLADFAAHMPGHNYIFKPTGALWPKSSVNVRLRPIHVGPGPDDSLLASVWLDIHRPVEAMTWAPGQPQLVHDRLAT